MSRFLPMSLRATAPCLFVFLLTCGAVAQNPRWEMAGSRSPEWFQSEEGQRLIENVLLYQFPSGGWPKNIRMGRPLSAAEKAGLADRPEDATIDNGATYSQLRLLARAYAATGDPRVRAAFLKGFDFLIKAQYDNGGWPMFYPVHKGYYTHIHFNDDGVAGVIMLLDDAAKGEPPFEFLDDHRRQQAANAVKRGIDCILKCQVVVDGQRTAWCAQHDEVTLAPASARTYEPVSLSGQESVGLVRCLMRVDDPSPEIVDAVCSAVRWFEEVKLEGLRLKLSPTDEGWDRVIEHDESGGPLWARFYEIGTNRPIFTGRDGIVRYEYMQVEPERRNNYAYYGDRPKEMLEEEFPAWAAKWGVSP